jgi:hypothetical protein
MSKFTDGPAGASALDFSGTTFTLGLAPATSQPLIATGSSIAGGSISTSFISGTFPVSAGGTGLTTVTAGTILYASATNTIAGLAAAAAGNVLLSGTTPSWGKVSLASGVTGILPIANGGTNSGALLTNNAVMVSNGTQIVSGTTMTDGQLLIGRTGNTPLAATLTGGQGVTIAPGVGTVTISVNPIPGYVRVVQKYSSITRAITSANGRVMPMPHTIPAGTFAVVGSTVVLYYMFSIAGTVNVRFSFGPASGTAPWTDQVITTTTTAGTGWLRATIARSSAIAVAIVFEGVVSTSVGFNVLSSQALTYSGGFASSPTVGMGFTCLTAGTTTLGMSSGYAMYYL